MATRLTSLLLILLFGWMQFGPESELQRPGTHDPLLPDRALSARAEVPTAPDPAPRPDGATPSLTGQAAEPAAPPEERVIPASMTVPAPASRPEPAGPATEPVQTPVVAATATAPSTALLAELASRSNALADLPDLPQVRSPLPDPDPVAVVTGRVVNLRSGPGTRFDVVDQLDRGTEVRILTTRSGWSKLQTFDPDTQRPIIGYMSARFLEETGELPQ